MTVLHIVATPRGDQSHTLQVTQELLKAFPDVETLNLFDVELPPLGGDSLQTKYDILTGQEPTYTPAWRTIEKLINQFLQADTVVISAPMWNFGIPYVLKHYIDCIVQPNYTFMYMNGSPVGLADLSRLIIVTSRGGEYTGDNKQYDHQESYLQTVFNFIGIHNITFIHAEPTAVSDDARTAALGLAHSQVKELIASW